MLYGWHYYAFDRPCAMAHATENDPNNKSPKSSDKGQSKSPPAKGPESDDQPAPLRVKQEPAAEADDHLRKLLEKPKPKAPPAQVTRPPAPAPSQQSGQRTINSYFNLAKGTPASAKDAKKPEDEEPKTPAIDLESIRGIFGWTTLGGVHIPFILRQEEKFMAVRIIETTLLQKYLKALPKEVYKCTFIKSYFITDNEAKLLNEINLRHCDRQYGAELFTTKDYVVPLSDVEQLYEFLTTCYHKLSRSAVAHRKEARCGILTVEGSAIPYIRRHNVRHVPLLLFDQEIVKQLEMKAEKLEAWEVSYLMFCCKVADIGSEFIMENSCLVVSLDDVQTAAGGTVQFEEWWPSAQGERHAPAEAWAASNGRTEASAGAKERPAQTQAPSMMISDYSQLYGYPKVQAPVASQLPAPPMLRSSSTDAGHRNFHGESSPSSVNGQFYRVLPNAPPPLLKDNGHHSKASSMQSLASGTRSSSYLNGMVNGVPASGHSSDLNAAAASSRLVRIGDSFLAKHLLNSNGALERSRAHHLENFVVAPGNVQAMAGKMSSPKPGNPVPVNVHHGDPSQRHTYLLDSIARTASAMPQAAHLEGLASPLLDPHLSNNMTSKLQQLLHSSSAGLQARPQPPQAAGEPPWTQKLHSTVPKYRLQHVQLSGSRFRAINSTEFQHASDLMVPLVELTMNLKARVSTTLCKHVLSNVLRIPLYRANAGQEEVIRAKLGNCETTLIRAADIHRYLPQLLYSVASLHLTQGDKDSQPTAKRARVENAVNS